jgi:tricorn protease-like protein
MGVGIVDGRWRSRAGATARLLALSVSVALVASGCAWVARASVDSAGLQGNGNVVNPPAISSDGRFVAFQSQATNLVAGDTNNIDDVFWRDMVTGTTRRVSVSSGNAQANTWSFNPAISADGRYVAYVSNASNLVSGDTNGWPDVFVRDTTAGTTTRVSVSNAGAQGNGSAAWSRPPAISSDGRYVAFESNSTNLVAADTNNAWDVFVRDRTLNTTKLVTLSTAGVQGSALQQGAGPRISPDGRYIVYSSTANLVTGDNNGAADVFVRDTTAGTTDRVSVSSAGVQQTLGSIEPAISSNGRYVTFRSLGRTLVSGDTNNTWDVFVRDRMTNTTSRVNVTSAGVQSANGGPQWPPAISGDGRYVAFDSTASDLIAGDTSAADVFVRDRTRNTTTRVSVDSAGTQSNGFSNGAAISGDGRYIAYVSSAANLVTNDSNGRWDVFVRANPVLTVASASPRSAARGAITTITLTGTNFLTGVSAHLGNNVTLIAVNRASENQVMLTINVESSAATGLRSVVVYNTGTGAGTLTGTAASFDLIIT